MDSEETGVTLLEDEDPNHPPKMPIPDQHAFGSKNITFIGFSFVELKYLVIYVSSREYCIIGE